MKCQINVKCIFLYEIKIYFTNIYKFFKLRAHIKCQMLIYNLNNSIIIYYIY